MRRTPRPHRLAAVAALAALSGLLATQPAPAQGTVGAEAVAACERAARQSVASRAGTAPVRFDAPPSAQPGLSGAGQAVLRGAGRWRGPDGMHSFSYSCNIDLRSGDAVGVAVRHADAQTASAPARPAAETDLSNLSPAACESSAAVALKQRWPRVSHIRFERGMRSLPDDATGSTGLRGRGRALPTPESPSTFFGFDCVIDPRDGRVLSTRILG